MATYWENSCSFGLRYVSWYKYLIVGLVFSHLGFWSGNLFLIAIFLIFAYLYLFIVQNGITFDVIFQHHMTFDCRDTSQSLCRLNCLVHVSLSYQL